jgi:hypothetical protein
MNFADKVFMRLSPGTRLRVLLDLPEADLLPVANLRAHGPGWVTLNVSLGGEDLVVSVDTARIISVSIDAKDVPAGE